MRKRVLAAVFLVLSLSVSAVLVQAEEIILPETVVDLAAETQETVLAEDLTETKSAEEEMPLADAEESETVTESVLPEAISLSFSVFPQSVCLEDKLTVTVTVDYAGEPAACGAVWMFNRSQISGFSNDSFQLTDKKTSTLSWDITEAWRGWGTMEVGFMLYGKDGTLSEIYQSFQIEDMTRKEAEKKYILELVKPVCVEGRIRQNTTLYGDVMLTRKIGTVSKDTVCQILNSKSGYSNQILMPDGKRGWVSLASLSVSQKDYTRRTDISNQEKDMFANSMAYESKTDYLVWVHLECQKVNIFLRKGDKWCIESVFPCASGKNATPTINGVFTYTARDNRWEYENYYVGPAMIFSGNYALHSVLLRYDGSIYDGTIGKPASNGCVRMYPQDINWMVDYVPFGTTVVVY